MDDSWSPAPAQPAMYWSVEHCAWLPCPVGVDVPSQREDEPAQEPSHA